MGEPAQVRPRAARVALAPVASLGVVLAGCPDCRLPIGVDGAEGLDLAVAAHRRRCPTRRRAARPATPPAQPQTPQAPAQDDVCPGCGCEAELHPRAGGPRCGDCLAELHTGDLAIPATTPAAPPGWPAAPTRRHGHRAKHRAKPTDGDRAAVA